MSFTISKNLEQLPSYPVLCEMAAQHEVQVTGNERAGSFRGRGVAGDYVCGADAIRGTFAAYGVTGTFSLEIGKAAVTVTEKPFWLPETLLTQKLTEGLETFCNEVVQRRPS